MTVAVQHRLEGLEPDNLLAFLALLGLLRALEAAELLPRVHWAGLPLRPVLIRTEGMSQEAVAASSDEGCGILAKRNDFGGETYLTFGPERARELLQAAARPDTKKRAAAMDCLFSDAALDKKGKLQPPPLCSMKSGTGHQHFLQRLRDIPGMTIAGGSAGAGLSPGERSAIGGKRGSAQQATSPDAKADLPNPGDIYAALFEAWHHTDRAPAFRWDPSEDRRYALRFGDPSNRSKKSNFDRSWRE